MDGLIEHSLTSLPVQFFSGLPLPAAIYTKDDGFYFKNRAWETTADFTVGTLSLIESRIKSIPDDCSGARTETCFSLRDIEGSVGEEAEGSVKPESDRKASWRFLVTPLTPSEEETSVYLIIASDRSRQFSPDEEFEELRQAISGLENVCEEDLRSTEARDNRVRRLLNESGTSTFLLDPDTYDVVEVNQKTTDKLDCTRSDLIGRNVKEIYERDGEDIKLFLDELPNDGNGGVDVLGGTIPEGGFSAIIEGASVALPERDVLLVSVKEITEESTMREKLETQKNYLSNVINTVPDIIVVLDHENRFTLVNEAAAEFFGVDRNRMIGMKPEDIFPDERAESILREHKDFLETGKRILREEQEVEHPKSGETKWFQQVKLVIDEKKPVDDREVLVIARDITRRKEYEQKLKESEKQIRLLAENIEELFWMTDPDKEEMLYLSPAAETILGRPREELYERPDAWMESIHPEDRDRVREALEDQKTGDYDEEYRVVRPDGKTRWIHDKAFPVKEDGTVTRIVGTAEDITERRKLQRELEEQALYDQLTGLPNRTLFKDRLTIAIERCRRQSDWPLAILFFDLDQFKEVNDTYGHVFGDELLRGN